MNPEPNVNYGCIYPILSMVNKIKNESIRTAVVSMALAITSIASTLLMGYILTVNILGFIALNVLSVIITLVALKVAITGLFSKGVNKTARSLCVVAILIDAIGVYIYIGINSINGII